MVLLMTADGGLVNRGEVFEEADLDAALARFEELHPQTRRLENAASKVLERFLAHFPAHRWDAMSEILADNSFTDDRRRLVGVGPRHDREIIIADWRAVANVGDRNRNRDSHCDTRGSPRALSSSFLRPRPAA